MAPAISSPRAETPRRDASVRTDCATSPNVRGSSDNTSAPTGQADARSLLDTAQTAQRSCVTIRSGASSAIRSASTTYSDPPSRSDSPHDLVDLQARQARRIKPRSRHHRPTHHLGRPTTLLRHPDERIDQTELRNDLGRTRQERTDPHQPDSSPESSRRCEGGHPAMSPNKTACGSRHQRTPERLRAAGRHCRRQAFWCTTWIPPELRADALPGADMPSSCVNPCHSLASRPLFRQQKSPVYRAFSMGGTGLEPVTPSLSSWCSPN